MSGGARLTRLFNQYVTQTRAHNSFSILIAKRLALLEASDDLRKSAFEFPLHQSDCHPFAMPTEGHHAHGGVITTVLQDVTTLHICAADSRDRKAVTTDVNVSFLGVGKVGRTLRIDSEVLKLGGSLAVAQANITDLSSGSVLAVGRHSMMFVGEDGGASKYSTILHSTYDV
mmetsp:Transcript_51991/g.123776  ORF Transcript_51991/g.123776 Transcript_51991/m.123776 type:complete len:172 (-) Transcript_51991:112-627(-)